MVVFTFTVCLKCASNDIPVVYFLLFVVKTILSVNKKARSAHETLYGLIGR